MFELNGTFVIFIALFLAFVFLYNEIALKPVGKVIEKRKARIKADLDAAQAANAEAQRIQAEYEKQLQGSRLQAQDLIQAAVTTAQSKRSEELKSIQQEGTERLNAVRTELAGERKGLIQSLVDQEVGLVKDIVGKLIGTGESVEVDRLSVERALEEAR